MWESDPDDDFEEIEDDDLDEDDRAATSPAVSIEITGLSLYTHHGVGEAEREVGQRLVFDIAFELDDCDATVTDRIEDTVNYAEVCEQVALGAQERNYKTLERLCAAVADRLIDRFGAESVRVKATKPEPPIPLPVDEVSVEVWKEVTDRATSGSAPTWETGSRTCAPRAMRSVSMGWRCSRPRRCTRPRRRAR